jgi:hypothetical protein
VAARSRTMPGLRCDVEAGAQLEAFLTVLANADKEKKITELTRALSGESHSAGRCGRQGAFVGHCLPVPSVVRRASPLSSIPTPALQVSTNGCRRPTKRT